MMLCGAEKLAEKETMRSTLCELLKLSRHLHSVSVVAKQAPPALSNAKVMQAWTLARCTRKKLPEFSFRQFFKPYSYDSMIYGASTVRISSVFPPSWIFRSIGLERSRLKIPMMDFASMTYLPETRSKSNLVRSFTKDFTLSMEFKEILTVFMSVFLPIFEYFLILVIKKPIFILNGHA